MPDLPAHDLAQRMAELARSVAAPRDIEAVLSGVTAMTVELLSGADTAGVIGPVERFPYKGQFYFVDAASAVGD